MQVRIFNHADTAAREAAIYIARAARKAAAERGKFVLALSGGKTPSSMLRALADEQVPWDRVHLLQVDERIAPDGDPDRNLTQIRENLLEHAAVPPEQVHAMPVEQVELQAGAYAYARTLQSVAGSPPVLDLTHLGLALTVILPLSP